MSADDDGHDDLISTLERELWQALKEAGIPFDPPLVGDMFHGAGLPWPTPEMLASLNDLTRERLRASLSKLLEQHVPASVVNAALARTLWDWSDSTE